MTQEEKYIILKKIDGIKNSTNNSRNNMKCIDAEKLNAEIERKIGICEKQRSDAIKAECYDLADDASARMGELHVILETIASLQHEQQKENKLPNKRTRVNYAICNLQSFKPLREAIVLDDYVYDGSKCYRENLLNYIHAIPENRLTEIRGYLKEKGWWPYDDDADWLEQEQPIEGKQVIIITETDGDANIHWDCRSLDDVEALLASAQSFITDKQVEKLRGPGSGPDYNTTEGRFRNAHKFRQEQPEVDLEKEIAEHAENMPHGEFTHESECVEHEEWAKIEFRHFYELGLNARKEE